MGASSVAVPASAPLAAAAELARPVTLAREHLLAVADELVPLLPVPGLRRGSVVSITGHHGKTTGVGVTSLALALLTAASRAGSWVGVVGLPSLSLEAATGLGLAPERVALIDAPPSRDRATVVAALLDGVDVVLVGPAVRLRAGDARRLAARARERGGVLLALGEAWPEAADVRLDVTVAGWLGLARGHGHLRARRVLVEASGRGAAARPRRLELWLPGPSGRVETVEPDEPVEPVEPAAELRGGEESLSPYEESATWLVDLA